MVQKSFKNCPKLPGSWAQFSALLGDPGRIRKGPKSTPGRGPRAPKSTPKGGPGGVREGTWCQAVSWTLLGRGRERFWTDFGTLLGGVLGSMLDLFGNVLECFSRHVFQDASGSLPGGVGPNLDPKWGPESSRKGSRNEARCETAKMLILTNPPMFLLVFYLQLGPQIGPKRLQNPVGKRSRVQNGKRTWTKKGPRNGLIYGQLGPYRLGANATKALTGLHEFLILAISRVEHSAY